MAGAAVMNAIGVISGVLGIFQFGMDNFAGADDKGSVLRIQLGLEVEGGATNMGGDLPDIRLFNEAGEFLGIEVDSGKIGDGIAKDVRVEQKEEQQATYALLTANDNAICIAYISITWPDEQKFGWTADWGKECGAPWYFSNIVIAGQAHKPACMWIDANGDQPVTAFQVHFPEFVSNEGAAEHDVSYYCQNGPPFSLYYHEDPRSITSWVPPTAKMRAKRATSARAVTPQHQHHRRAEKLYSKDSRLVISRDPKQSPAELCDDPVSLGPNFLNIALGQFCRMSTKTLYPVCAPPIQDHCFNQETRKLILGGIAARDVEYPEVLDWS